MPPPPPPPPWDFSPSKLNFAHYTHTSPPPPQMSSNPPLGIFLNDPLLSSPIYIWQVGSIATCTQTRKCNKISHRWKTVPYYILYYIDCPRRNHQRSSLMISHQSYCNYSCSFLNDWKNQVPISRNSAP